MRRRITSAARSRTAPRSAFRARLRAGAEAVAEVAPHPTNPNLFYAGSQGALLTKFDRRTGYTRDIQVYPLFFSGESAGSLKERWQWTFPIVFSPLDANALYTSSQHLWRTID